MQFETEHYLRLQLIRHLRVGLRRPGDVLNPLLFFLMVVALFPLGLGPDPKRLAEMAPGIFWVVALLSNLTVSSKLFAADYEDGSLEQMILAPQSLALSAMTEVFAHWMLSGVTLTVVSPVFAIMLNLPFQAIPMLISSLFFGTLCLSLIGAIGAGLTVGLRRGGMLLSLLTIPLTVPILVFGTHAVGMAAQGHDANSWLALICAFAAGGLVLAPLAISASLKISIEN